MLFPSLVWRTRPDFLREPQQLWQILNSLPTALAKEFADQKTKQKEYLAVRRDLNATSSQDEFAKWAKLRRQHDKLLEELEKKSTLSYCIGISIKEKSR